MAELPPMLLAELPRPFSDPAWTFELKFDGYRLMAEVEAGRCALKSRNGANATGWFPEVAAGLATLAGGPHVLDGEACVLDELGRSDFDRLHARARRRRNWPGADPVVFCAFDALVIGGRNIMGRPLTARKAALKRLLAGRPPSVLYVSGIEGDGEGLFAQAVALRLEGIVAKLLASIYQPGVRSDDWIKLKRPGAVPAQRFDRKGSA